MRPTFRKSPVLYLITRNRSLYLFVARLLDGWKPFHDAVSRQVWSELGNDEDFKAGMQRAKADFETGRTYRRRGE